MSISSVKDGKIIFSNHDYIKSATEHKKFETSDRNQYKLFGIMNMFDFVPDFVYLKIKENTIFKIVIIV